MSHQYRKLEDVRYSRCVSVEELEINYYNLNISGYVRTTTSAQIIDMKAVNDELNAIEK